MRRPYGQRPTSVGMEAICHHIAIEEVHPRRGVAAKLRLQQWEQIDQCEA